MNRLYYGDCLTVMEESIPDGTVDLIYLDPPFNSNRNYNAIYKDETGRQLPDQIDAFCDMWELDPATERGINHMPILVREAGIDDDVAQFWRLWMNALRHTQPRLLAYLYYMTIRLLRMRNLLKPDGSIYLHCDQTASHYIKVLMDGIFGHDQFRNDVVWRRATSHNDGNQFGRITDHILFYTRGKRWTWNGDAIAVPRTEEEIEQKYPYDDHDGRGRYSSDNLTGPSHGMASGPPSTQPWHGYDVLSRGRVWSAPKTGAYAAFIDLEFIPGYRNIEGVHDRLDALDAAGLIRHPVTGFWPGLKRYAQADSGKPPQNIILNPTGFTNYTVGHGGTWASRPRSRSGCWSN